MLVSVAGSSGPPGEFLAASELSVMSPTPGLRQPFIGVQVSVFRMVVDDDEAVHGVRLREQNFALSGGFLGTERGNLKPEHRNL